MPPTDTSLRQPIREALELLGKRRMLLAIHDVSFPSLAEEDLGRGSPYGRGARALFQLAHALGFDAVQLGPQGLSSRSNPSPYDGTYFSRNVLSIDLFGLAEDPDWGGLVNRTLLEAAVAANPRHAAARTAHTHAWDAVHAVLAEAWKRLAVADASPGALRVKQQLARFWDRHRRWLEPDALYAAISRQHGGRSFGDWPGEERLLYARAGGPDAARRDELRARLLERHAEAIGQYALGQLAVHLQHEDFRAGLQPLGLSLFGDLQVGSSIADVWSRGALYLPGYRMGAPPSRTNPEGQPWGYGVLDPELYRDGSAEGPALAFFRDRVGKVLDECDGLRVDHPHGLVCPWVYREEDPDPFHAVQTGARLFDSPGLVDHPELARFAIPRPEQLDLEQPRFADGWVRQLDGEQVDRYAVLLDALAQEFRSRGRDPQDLACEVLSTMPHPLGRVLQRHGLGRFRVTQKANLQNPLDVYRSENARVEDWVMVGTHDTAPLWRLARRWPEETVREQAAYLAWRLDGRGEVDRLARHLAEDRTRLVQAKLADLLACPARHVVVFFADLFGIDEVYNVPGTVTEDNWSLRLRPDFEERYRQDVARGQALDLAAALAMALRAQAPELVHANEGLIRRLEEAAPRRPSD